MMAILDSIGTLIHDTADALVQSEITKKMSDMYSGFISAGFGVVDESLKVVRDVTSPPPPPPPGP
jgi:hypothetical protein